MEYEPLFLLAFAAVGLAAGFIDAIAGGGGLISVPALLTGGLSPIAALATNKFQSSIGTAMAARTYWRRGFIDLRTTWPAMALSFVAAFVGAYAVKLVDTSVLMVLTPVALICIAAYFLFAPQLSDSDRQTRLAPMLFVPVMAMVVGFYDGLFGPGTGSFLTIGFVALFGFGLTRAAGTTKAINVMTNLGALALFISTGDVVWPVALAMAAGQFVGGYAGARTGIRFGARLIRPLVVVISVALAIRLLLGGLTSLSIPVGGGS